jgi:diguanylate cyclase (GGDEF)-like protein
MFFALPLIFFAMAWSTYWLATFMNGISPLWLPASVLLTCLIRTESRKWPVLIALSFGANLAANLVIGTDLLVLLNICVVNVAETLLAAAGIRRFTDGEIWFKSTKWIACFLAIAVASCAAATAVGALVLSLAGYPYLVIWRDWVASDSLGFLIGTPFLLSWTEPALLHGVTRWRMLEAAILTCLVGGVAYLSFVSAAPILFLVFPCLAFITLRAGLPGATAGVLTVSAVLLWFTSLGTGPIAALPDTQHGFVRSLVLQAYFLTAMLSTIPIAVVLALREAFAKELKQQHAISSGALNSMAQGLCMFDEQDRLIICNQRYLDLYDLPDSLTAPGTPLIRIVRREGDVGGLPVPPEQHLRDLVAVADSKQAYSELELGDGRVVEIQCRTLPDGSWIATHGDITEKKRVNDRVAYLANHDVLTGLANRSFFGEELQRLFAWTDRGHGFALLSLDLDHFKEVNDTLGHAIGDALLKEVSARLRAATRDSDFVTRLGGDEFAILQFPYNRPEDAATLAARLTEVLAEPFHIDGHDMIIGTTVGIAIAPRDARDAAELLRKGDMALYRAKLEGRGTYRFFEAGMDSVQQARRVLENELRTAIREGEFELHYQPILDLQTGAVTSLEALIRWRHPLRGLVQHSEFMPTAEESGLILPIGEWALREACRQAGTWPEAIIVAVNLSSLHFKSRGLVALVTSALTGARLDPARLELEITETVLLQEPETVLDTLHQIHQLGVGVTMDNFGSGNSNLNYLRRFPFTRIKIDQSLVCDMATQPDAAAIVNATVKLTSLLGITSSAEGVETAEQLDVLRAGGCSQVQGCCVGQPVPAEKVSQMLAQFPATSRPTGQRAAG